MRSAIVGFAAGVWLLQWQAELPGWAVIAAGLAIPSVLALAWLALSLRVAAPSPEPRALSHRFLHAFAATLLGAIFGFAWAAAVAQWRLADRLDPAWEGRDVTLTGVIAGLPQPFERGVRFEFEVEAVQPAEAIVPQRVSIAWYNDLTPEEYQVVMPVRAGERWRLAVRLRLPHGLANPHGFDYEAWLLERGIRATGFVNVRGGERIDALVKRPSYLIERLRENIRERFQDALEGAPYAGILIALAIGDQRAIELADWQVFARTGVSGAPGSDLDAPCAQAGIDRAMKAQGK